MKLSRIMVLFLILTMFVVNGCGYKLGIVGHDSTIKKIFCYTVVNQTRKPGLEMPMTNAIIRGIQHYGAHLETVNKDIADTYLVVVLTEFNRSASRFDKSNFTEESLVSLFADVRLYHGQVDAHEVASGKVSDDSIEPFYETNISVSATYFLYPNQPEGERSIMPQLYDKLSRQIINRILERWVDPEENLN